MTVARLNGYDVGLPDAALERAFNHRRAAAALVRGAPDCPPSAQAFLAALEEDVDRGISFDLAGTPWWARAAIPLHPTLLVPASQFGPQPPSLPAAVVEYLVTRPPVPVVPDAPAPPALPPPLLRALDSPVRQPSPAPPSSPPYVPRSPSPAPPSPRSTPPPPPSPARSPSPPLPFPRSPTPSRPARGADPLFIPSPSPVAGPSGTRHSPTPPPLPSSPQDIEMRDPESREPSPVAALSIAASPPREPSPPPRPRLVIRLPVRPPPAPLPRRPPPFVLMPDGSRVFAPRSRPSAPAPSAPSAPAPPLLPITPASGSVRPRDIIPPEFPPLGSKDRDRRGHFLYEALTPCVECAKLQQSQRCRVDGVAGHACVYCVVRHRKCSLASPGKSPPRLSSRLLTRCPFFAARDYPVRFVGGHPLVSRAVAAAAAMPFDPLPPLLVPGPLPVPANLLHAYGEGIADAQPPSLAASTSATASTRRTRSTSQRDPPPRLSSLRSRTRALATQARQAVASTSQLVAAGRDDTDDDDDETSGGESDEEVDQLFDVPESESSQ